MRRRIAAEMWQRLLVLSLLTGTAFGQTLPTNTAHTMSSNAVDVEAINKVLMAYQDALNQGNPEASLKLYTEDAVVMAPNSQTLTGKPAIRAAYEAGSKMIAFKVHFTVESVVQTAPGWAFARTASSGTTTVKSSGTVVEEANQELFILRKDQSGQWRIAVYSFSSTKPATP